MEAFVGRQHIFSYPKIPFFRIFYCIIWLKIINESLYNQIKDNYTDCFPNDEIMWLFDVGLCVHNSPIICQEKQSCISIIMLCIINVYMCFLSTDDGVFGAHKPITTIRHFCHSSKILYITLYFIVNLIKYCIMIKWLGYMFV